jgi:hypothetical protein
MARRHTVPTVWLGALGCALALSGCWFQAFEPGGHRCATQSDCLAGYQCVSSVCVPGEPADAGGDVGPIPDDAGQDAAADAPTDAPIALDAPTDAPVALDAPMPMDAPGLLDALDAAAPLGEAGAPDASEAGIDPEAGLDGGQDAAMIEAGPEDAAMIEAGPEDAAMIEAGPEDAALDPGPG